MHRKVRRRVEGATRASVVRCPYCVRSHPVCAGTPALRRPGHSVVRSGPLRRKLMTASHRARRVTRTGVRASWYLACTDPPNSGGALCPTSPFCPRRREK